MADSSISCPVGERFEDGVFISDDARDDAFSADTEALLPKVAVLDTENDTDCKSSKKW